MSEAEIVCSVLYFMEISPPDFEQTIIIFEKGNKAAVLYFAYESHCAAFPVLFVKELPNFARFVNELTNFRPLR